MTPRQKKPTGFLRNGGRPLATEIVDDEVIASLNEESASRDPEPTPKRRGRPPGSKNKNPSSRGPGRRKDLSKPLQELFGSIGVMASFANPYDGTVILSNSERLAKELNDLAKQNDSVYNTLRLVTETSAWAGVVTVSAAVLVPILMNHGMLPYSQMALQFMQAPPLAPPGTEPADIVGSNGQVPTDAPTNLWEQAKQANGN